MNPGRWLVGAAAAAVAMLLLCATALGSCATLAGLLPPACHSPASPPTRPAEPAEPAGPAGPGPDCTPPVAAWDHEQVANAAVIVEVGVDRGVPVWGQVIAVAVAMQESRLRNLDHGDRGPLGLFQQRPDQGWGSRSQPLDPAHAARTFYHKLLAVDGWQRLPLSAAAQAVQHSAHPDAYTAWADDAATLVAAVSPHPVGWVPPVHAPIISGFRAPDRPDHLGVDLGAARGQIVVAASAGTVTTVACQARHVDGSLYGCDRDGHPDFLGCGWYVDITHPGGVTTRYCHLHTRPFVDQGQQVVAGQPIGQVGSTGRSSGPHLHYETWTIANGMPVPVDPTVFMQQRGASLQPLL
jgi:murein DD-endopeptidase MepM/ murein hydrolase activator NlpD